PTTPPPTAHPNRLAANGGQSRPIAIFRDSQPTQPQPHLTLNRAKTTPKRSFAAAVAPSASRGLSKGDLPLHAWLIPVPPARVVTISSLLPPSQPPAVPARSHRSRRHTEREVHLTLRNQ